ncbi:hypothetical protein Avbf_03460 [Armadillidium vulgare]|nr:hypothetical protein Avbf_03460 [Armadillidium vulgare]
MTFSLCHYNVKDKPTENFEGKNSEIRLPLVTSQIRLKFLMPYSRQGYSIFWEKPDINANKDLMSGTLPKSPSEGDLTSNSAELPHTLNKRSLSRSFLPLGTNKFYLPPDLKKGAFASSNIRIVWKSATYGDLSNLNKVLDLPSVPKRSPSPITPKVGPTDHVFSEYFDPLAVHKREYVESSEEEDPDNKSVSSSFHRPVDRKRLDTDIEEIDMPSVKVLKSLFEKSKEEKSKDVPHFTRTSKKLKSNLEKNVTTPTDEPKDLGTDIDNTEMKVRETKENVKNLSLIIINEKEKSLSKENKKDEGHPTEHNIHESEKLKLTETKVKTSSKDINIEADHIRKVKDLLSIFKSMESRKEVSSTVNDSSTEKAITETSSKIMEKDVEIVDSDKEKTSK